MCSKRVSTQEIYVEPRGSMGSLYSLGSQGTYMPPEDMTHDYRATIMPEDGRDTASTRDDSGAEDIARRQEKDEKDIRLPTLAMISPPVSGVESLLTERTLAEHEHMSQTFEFADDDQTTYTGMRGTSIASSQALGNMLFDAEERSTETIILDFDLSKGKLGIDITALSKSVHVWNIQPAADKLVNLYNAEHPHKPIQIGDQIVSCNGETKPKSIGMALKEAYRGRKVVNVGIRKRMRQFTVCLNEQIPPPKLGIVCKVSSEPKVYCQGVKKGLIHSWSAKHPLRCVCPGDEILEVNGCTGDEIVKSLLMWEKTHDDPLYMIIKAKD